MPKAVESCLLVRRQNMEEAAPPGSPVSPGSSLDAVGPSGRFRKVRNRFCDEKALELVNLRRVSPVQAIPPERDAL